MPNTFGNYNYDLLCFLTDYPFTRQAKMRQADFVTGDGSFTAGGGIGAASQRLTGFIGGTLLGTNSIIDVWRTFVGFHNPGSPAALYLDYYEGTSFPYADPFFYRTPKRGPFPLIAGNNPFAVQGTVYSLPFLTFNVTSPGAGTGTVTVGHNGGTFLMKIGTPGVYTVDARQGLVQFQGSYFFGWDGVFPRMNGGISSILQVAYG